MPSKIFPTDVQLHSVSKTLDITFDDGKTYTLPCEYLRVYSPSAEVMGHGSGQGTLQLGKKDVGILSVEQVGNYALRLVFDDGHSSGIYTWGYLYDLGANHQEHWQKYLDRVAVAKKA